jgi:hypothetical protein
MRPGMIQYETDECNSKPRSKWKPCRQWYIALKRANPTGIEDAPHPSSLVRRVVCSSQHALSFRYCWRCSLRRIRRLFVRGRLGLRSSCRRSLESMVQRLERERSSPLRLFAPAHPSTPTSVIEQAGQSSLSPRKDLLIPRCDILVRKRSAYLQRHQKSVDLVGDECDGGLDHVWEKACERERLARITLDAQSIGRCTGEVWLALEEPEIRPAGQETQPRENGCGVRPKRHAADRVEEQEEGREMLDAHLDQALEDGHRVLGDKLLQGNEKGGLDGYSAADLG